MPDLIALLLMSAAAYRVARFVQRDTLIEEVRVWFNDRLSAKPAVWRLKVTDAVLLCPYCLTIWTGLASTLAWAWWTGDWPGWGVLWVWMAVSSLALVWWRIVEGDA